MPRLAQRNTLSLAAALVLHAGLLASGSWFVHRSPQAQLTASQLDDEIAVELLKLPETEHRAVRARGAVESSAVESSAANGAAPVGGLLPSRRLPFTPRHSRAEELAETDAGQTTPLEVEMAPGPSATNPGTQSPHHSTSGNQEADESAPGLSLEDMGVGRTTPWVVGDVLSHQGITDEDRLERNMAQAVVDHDSSRGTGSQGLITATFNQVATGLAPPKSNARITVVADAAGNITYIEVVHASREIEQWRRVAERALLALRGKQLRHQVGRPISMLFEVDSKVLLPSGRTRGSNVTVLGIPVNESGDDNSTQVKVLTPEIKLEQVEVLDPTESGGKSIKIPVPMVSMTVLGVNGDLVDIGAEARQVVHTRLLSQRVL